MNLRPLNLLLIEDESSDASLICGMLAEATRVRFNVERAERLSSATERLSRGGIDAVLVDLQLPDSRGLDTFRSVHSQASTIALIVLTGLDDETLGLKAVRAGAQDYLLKSQIDPDVLGRSICYAVERKRAEVLLRESERRFRIIYDLAPIGIVIVDADGNLLHVNPALQKMLGYSEDELRGMTFMQLTHPDDLEQNLDASRKLVDGRCDSLFLESRARRKDGCFVCCQVAARAVRDPQDRFLHTVAMVYDITEQKQAEQELREMNASLQNAFEGICRLDTEGRYVTVNRAYAHMLGYEPEEIVGMLGRDTTVPEDHADRDAAYYRMRATGRSQFECRGRRCDGSVFYKHVVMSQVVDANGAFAGNYSFVKDITEREMLKKELAELTVREQRRIGQDVHDGLGQVLTGLGHMAQSLVQKLRSQALPEVDTAVELVDGIQRARAQVRTIIKNLIPVEIDREGLLSALRELTAHTQRRYGITCWFNCHEPARVDDTNVATHLYRIAQEAVNNAVKHGRPKNIIVSFEADEGLISLSIRDDGVGTTSQADRTSGMGLRIMRYRAEVIGATLDIRLAKRGGSIVTCSLIQEKRDGQENIQSG